MIALRDLGGLLRPRNPPEDESARSEENSEPLLRACGARPIATVAAGRDGHRGRRRNRAVEPGGPRRGVGRATAAAAERRRGARGIPEISLVVRAENAAAGGSPRRLGDRRRPLLVSGRRRAARADHSAAGTGTGSLITRRSTGSMRKRRSW